MKADGLLPLAAHRYYAEAEKALMQMDGMILGSQRIHCNWAKDKHETLSLSHGAVHRVTPFGSLLVLVTKPQCLNAVSWLDMVLNICGVLPVGGSRKRGCLHRQPRSGSDTC